MGLLISIVGALTRALAGPILAGLLVAGGAAFWLMSQDRGDFAERHRNWVGSLNADAERIRTVMVEIDKRKAVITEEIAAQEVKGTQANKIIANLHDLESTWDRYVGNPEQQKANAEQIRRLEEMKTRSQANAENLRREFRRKVWERDGLEIDLEKVKEQIAFAEEHSSRFAYYTDKAWRQYQWVILGAPVLYLLVGWMWRMRRMWRSIPDAR